MEKIFFRDHFNLRQKEENLEFVNIPLNTDKKAYIDAFMISKTPGEWFARANNTLIDYFEELIASIKKNDEVVGHRLLGKLKEPNETHLGLSSGFPDGCGIGREQSKDLFESLKNSKAAQTGHLSDLSDCELMIEGIGSDKISDLTTNIIRGHLIEFTEEQCAKLRIPTRAVRSQPYWSEEDNKWVTRIAHLPFYNDKPILLVPKNIVRKRTVLDYRSFYEIVMVPYLVEEHLSLNTALVRVLQGGRRRVNKKDVRKEYPCKKKKVYEFIEKHPESLAKYKATRI